MFIKSYNRYMTQSINIYDMTYKNYTQKLDKPLTIIRGSRWAQKGGTEGVFFDPFFDPKKHKKMKKNTIV